ncbi:MAG: class I SAM-dependent methyltransferase [Spirochaetales bacterium]|nr:class I SAM-dependent methyltransferase [Spirochaetales bacterium]
MYNSIGKNYNSTRKPDARILEIIIEELDCVQNSLIADIGAGTGNYTRELARHGYKLFAVEPSQTMIDQAEKHPGISWIQGSAEKLPLGNESMDGIVCTLASHHFQSLDKAYHEFHRILKPKGTFVVFTFDPRLMDKNNWLAKYFPVLIEQAAQMVPPQAELIKLVERVFGRNNKIRDFPLSPNLTDKFFASGWKNPWLYIDDDFRKGISSFALSDKKVIKSYITKLKADLENETWQREYPYIEQMDSFNGGYYFIRCKK